MHWRRRKNNLLWPVSPQLAVGRASLGKEGRLSAQVQLGGNNLSGNGFLSCTGKVCAAPLSELCLVHGM